MITFLTYQMFKDSEEFVESNPYSELEKCRLFLTFFLDIILTLDIISRLT